MNRQINLLINGKGGLRSFSYRKRTIIPGNAKTPGLSSYVCLRAPRRLRVPFPDLMMPLLCAAASVRD